MVPDITNTFIPIDRYSNVAVYDVETKTRISNDVLTKYDELFNSVLVDPASDECKNLKEKLDSNLTNTVFNILYRRLLEFNSSRLEAWTGLPTESTGNVIECDKDLFEEDYVPNNSYVSALSEFAQPVIPFISFNTEVTSIHSNNESEHKVSISTIDNQHYKADAVIVTVPLGVLKSQSISFHPELSAEKLSAIDHLGMGLLNKVYLFFSCEEPFWPKELDIIGVALSPGEYKENCNMYLSLYNTNPGVVALCAMLSGDFAEISESMDDEALMLRVMTPLLSLFPQTCPNRPDSFYRTAWRSDKFARGSYSALQCQSKLEDRVALAQPHDEVVFFAGEACSLDHPSCVNGAAINGEQVAAMVLALLDKSNQET